VDSIASALGLGGLGFAVAVLVLVGTLAVLIAAFRPNRQYLGVERGRRPEPGAALKTTRAAGGDHAPQHVRPLQRRVRAAGGQHVAHPQSAQVAVGLDRVPGGVDRLVEGDGRAVGRGDEQPQQAAVDGVLLGEHADDEADLDGRRQRPSRTADPLRARVVAHLPGQRHHAPDVGDHGAPLVGVEDEGAPARADHDAQAEGGGVGPGGPVGARDGAAPLDLLPGGEDGRLDRADRRRRAAGGEVVAQLGPVRARPRGYAHALDVLQADLDGDVGQVAPGRVGGGRVAQRPQGRGRAGEPHCIHGPSVACPTPREGGSGCESVR